MQSSRSSAQIQLAPNLSRFLTSRHTAVPRACGCQGTLMEPLSWKAHMAFFLLRPLHHTADGHPACSSCFCFSSCSSYPPAPSRQETRSQPTSRSQSEALWLLSPPLTPAGGSLGSSPGLSTRRSSRKPGDRVPQSCSPCLPKFPTSLPPWEALMSAGHAGLMGCPQLPLSLWWTPSI